MKIDWTKPLRTQDGNCAVVAVSVLPTGVNVCLKSLKTGELSAHKYTVDGLYRGAEKTAEYSLHLVQNVERRWRWLAKGSNEAEIFVTEGYYKDQSEADGIGLTLLVKCESLFEDTPISN